MIKITNLTKKYGSVTIFDDASFSFPDKGLVTVLGASGCGKTTLLNLIAGFDTDYDGEIFVCGTELSKNDDNFLSSYRRDNIGFVFQNYHLLSGYTALQNITLAADGAGQSGELKGKELLKRFSLPDKADKKIETLSGGEKQRVAIARALVNEPSIILADEPTGALDRKNSTEIMEMLKALSREKLVIVITHDKKCAEYSDITVTVQNGKLTSDATAPDEENTELRFNNEAKISVMKRAFKNFGVHFKRYTAVAFAISLGVLCFVFSLSSGNITKRSIDEFEAKNTAYHNGYVKTENHEELIKRLSEDERIEDVYVQYILPNVSVKIGETTVEISEKYPSAKATQKMSFGVMPRKGENEIAISPSMAAKFDRDIQSLIGKSAELVFNGKTYFVTVSGIFNATFDDCFVSSDIERAMYDGVGGKPYSVSYDVADFEDIVSVSGELHNKGIPSDDASKEVASFLQTFKNINRMFFVVSLLVFAAGIFISVILLVKQQNTRYRETGLLAALGYKRKHINCILTGECALLCIWSSIISGLLLLICEVCLSIFKVNFSFDILQIFLSMILTAAIIFAVNFLINLRLIRTKPAEALRK